MAEATNTLALTVNLFDSDMSGTLICGYFLLILLLLVSFVNIYSVDKYEFLHNKQRCFECKRKLPFLITYAKNKQVISKKTFVLELIGYFILVFTVTSVIISVTVNVKTTPAFILLGICTLKVFVFGCVTGELYRRTKTK